MKRVSTPLRRPVIQADDLDFLAGASAGKGLATDWLAGKLTEAVEPLYGPAGDLDGTQVHLPSDRAQAFTRNLQAGRVLSAQGCGVAAPSTGVRLSSPAPPPRRGAG